MSETQIDKSFWCDDFDTDLLKLFPDLADFRPLASQVPLWTLGTTCKTNGRLSHPAVWNGVGALYWSTPPDLERDEHGWANIGGLVTNDQLLDVTVLEAVRDCWVHTYFASLDGTGWMKPLNFNTVFYPIMANVRGWNGYEDVGALLTLTRQWAENAIRNALFRCVGMEQ